MYVFISFYSEPDLAPTTTKAPTPPPPTQPPTTLVPPECSDWRPEYCENGGTVSYLQTENGNYYCGCKCLAGWTNFYCTGEKIKVQIVD